jgi:hypothetical protein
VRWDGESRKSRRLEARRVETRRWNIGKSAFADCGVCIRASVLAAALPMLLAQTASAAQTKPLPRTEMSVEQKPVVREGGLRVVVAANSFAPTTLQPIPIPITADSVDARVDLAPLRDLYLASVRDERAIAKGLAEVKRLRETTHPPPGGALDATLTAYTGALLTLRAKHAFWPPQKLAHLRQGLAILDRAVERSPDHAEARYLRLMSCYYLPGILGRGGSVRADFAALARLLPNVRAQYPRELYDAITRFVVERGRLPDEQRRVLEDTLVAADA